VRNLLDAGRWVAQAALQRTETRGSHVRSDFPRTDDALCRHLPIHPEPAAAASDRWRASAAAPGS
jgi:succinate dehydrogenase/fumarate reductase flavoprotein subunit